ncbi:MAG: nuclear transport factor 2 family protein [Bacteroidetes bacterium]|nr:nuclear transport factor 2 family protein [Bacteroidota bacterium]
MKLIKKIKEEVTEAYDTWLNSYLNGDVKTYNSYLDDAYHFIGSTNNEEFLNRKDTTIFFKATADQLAGKTDIKNKTRIIEIFDGLVFITEIFDAYFLMESEWAYYGKFRFTSVLQKKSEGWRFIYQHFSMPDSKAQEGETLGGEKVSKENQELRDAIKRRTAELEIKNRELEIETSLERVRAQAMAMHQPDDLLNICKTLYKEFNTLGFGEMRNTMINIHNDADKSFINYDYSDEIGKTTNHLTYTIHPLVEKQIKKIRSAKDAFSETYFEGKDLTEWKKFRKKIGEKTDSRLATTKGLYYYFYSIGIGSIGISTFGPISSEKKILLKRFRNVFNLSYQRYIDIANAEAQAKEARIETALERVRAIAMAMRKPEDLASIGETLFTELKALNFADIRNTEMIINNDSKETIKSYYYSDYGITGFIEMSYKTNPVLQKWIDDLKKADDAFAEVIIPKNEMKAWIQFRESIGYLPDPKLNKATSVYYYSYSIGLGALSISSFQAISEAQVKILERFRNVFNLSYQRYSDIAQAKLQAREAEIELALERVRARTMAMQHSDELQDAAIILFQQLKNLGIETGSCGFNIWDENEKTATVWMSSPEGSLQAPFTLPHTESKIYKEVISAKKNNEDFKVIVVKGKALIKHFDYLITLTGIGEVIKKLRESNYVFPEKMIYHFAFFNNGYLTFHTHESVTEAHAIFKRFAKVFEQTYTRFIDLQKAEASAKEAQIEAALEKVRSRSLAMHKAEELGEVVTVIVEKMRELNLPVDDGVALVTHIEGSKNQIEWLENPGFPSAIKFYQTYFDHPILSDYWKAKMEGLDFIAPRYTAEESRSFLNHIFQFSDYKHTPQEIKDYCLAANTYSYSAAFQKNSSIFINDYSGRSLSEQEINLVIRFSKVFEQTYTRFLDLQKAEAQAREAQIEAALEKVRSHSMGMQKSEELKDVIKIVYQQLTSLKINLDHAGFVVDYKPKDDWHFWIADEQDIPSKITHPYFESVWANQFNAAKEKDEDYFTTNLNFEEKNKFYNQLLSYVPDLPKASIDFYLSCPGLAAATVLFDNASLYMENFSGIPYSDEENKILMRFGKVFQQTYTRFLDLQKAEAQTREAKIEASLEKVRSVTLGLQKSDELLEITQVLYDQLYELGFKNIRNSIIDIHNEENETFLDYDYSPEMGKSITLMSYYDHPIIEKQVRKMESSNDAFFEIILEGQDLQDLIDLRIKNGEEEDTRLLNINQLTYNFYSFGDGGIGLSNFGILSDEQKLVLKRFRNVFAFAYKRYKDLAQAEAQAKEAQIQLALERVRARTMAMQSSDELAETSVVVFQQLMHLGLKPNRLFIGIIKEENGNIEAWATNEDGTKIANHFVLNIEKNASVKKMYNGWKEKKTTLTIDMQGEELKNYFHYLAEEMQIPFKDGLSQNRRIQTIAYFSKGFIGIASPEEQAEETTKLLERFAAVFNLTFTRFNDLKIAEAHAIQAEEDLIKLQTEKKRAEEALIELKSTQSQLIQAEKMASLGELTAGIAHEIQNPLNFVNNFSEVSKELLDEMKDELEKGNLDDAKEIMKDIIQNLEKINHHGKRADGIVKGMLQHSRSSSGIKEPTDINVVCDEYLRLSYHGLRAKDKSFNANMKTDFDLSISKINIIPQDIGRVILNLLTNAFYAVDEKKKSGLIKYEPTVSITTKRIGVIVEIKVSDNGNGIPQKVLDKIFQPFFTTKPTGQGTGLGLSLSYDIITKGHGGELKVETKEGEGTTFIIQLSVKKQ